MSIKLVTNTMHAYAEEARNAMDMVVRKTANVPKEAFPNVITIIARLALIQQLRVNTYITSYELGGEALGHLEDILYNTLFDMVKDYDDSTKLVTSTTTRACTNDERDMRNTIETALTNATPEAPASTRGIHIHLAFVQQLRTDTDIASHRLGREAIEYLEDALYDILLNTERDILPHEY